MTDRRSTLETWRVCSRCKNKMYEDTGQIYECQRCGMTMCHNCASSAGWTCPSCNDSKAHLNQKR